MSNDNNSICVIGIGSAFGADQLGFLCCERLRQLEWPNDIDWYLCRTPAQLPELISDCKKAFLIDSLISDESVTDIKLIEYPQLQKKYQSKLSSHGLGVREALELADKLKQIPQALYILGIPIKQDTELVDSLIEESVTQAREMILGLI